MYGGITGPILGKTGTTQNHSDGWFCGVTPQLAAAAWTGADLRSIHFDDIGRGQGANMALPIWGHFMKKVYADESLKYKPNAADFEKPMNFTMDLDCDEEEGQNKKSAEFEDFF